MKFPLILLRPPSDHLLVKLGPQASMETVFLPSWEKVVTIWIIILSKIAHIDLDPQFLPLARSFRASDICLLSTWTFHTNVHPNRTKITRVMVKDSDGQVNNNIFSLFFDILAYCVLKGALRSKIQKRHFVGFIWLNILGVYLKK